jgi:broad specificity phosphatase PhoE
MTTFFLIRHGAHDWLGKGLAGRLEGVHLNAEGEEQSRRLVQVLQNDRIDAIYSSPLERTRETAEPLARSRKLPVQIAAELLEVDFGEWTGLTLEQLNQRDDWKFFITLRDRAPIPGGEWMIEAQARAVLWLESRARAHPDQTLAIFSHGDVLRLILAYYLGIPTAFLLRFEVFPASISTLVLGPRQPSVLSINDCRAARAKNGD